MAQDGLRNSPILHTIRMETDTAPNPPTSAPSGCTLMSSPLLQDSNLDLMLLQAAEEPSIKAGKGSSVLSPFYYYDDLIPEVFTEDEYERERLITAAEMENVDTGTEDRAMSPTVYFASPSPPIEMGQVSCCFLSNDVPTKK